MFDSNVHPTVDGAWIDGRPLCDFGHTQEELRKAGFTHACAVALPGVGSYEPGAFAAAARDGSDFWIPIAAWNSSTFECAHAVATMKRLRAMGYMGVKVHPRLLKRMPEAEELAIVIAAANEVGLPILLCSYPFGNPASNLRGNILGILSRALQQCPQAPIMLLHAGCVDFLRFVEFARANPNVLLDLSFTMMKYQGMPWTPICNLHSELLISASAWAVTFPSSSLRRCARGSGSWQSRRVSIRRKRAISRFSMPADFSTSTSIHCRSVGSPLGRAAGRIQARTPRPRIPAKADAASLVQRRIPCLAGICCLATLPNARGVMNAVPKPHRRRTRSGTGAIDFHDEPDGNQRPRIHRGAL